MSASSIRSTPVRGRSLTSRKQNDLKKHTKDLFEGAGFRADHLKVDRNSLKVYAFIHPKSSECKVSPKKFVESLRVLDVIKVYNMGSHAFGTSVEFSFKHGPFSHKFQRKSQLQESKPRARSSQRKSYTRRQVSRERKPSPRRSTRSSKSTQ